MSKQEAPLAVTVFLVKGENLPGLDWGGVSDPYCKFICGDHKTVSEVYYKDNNPTWNQLYTVEAEEGTKEMKVEVWDKDMIEDDLMGSFSIKLPKLNNDIDAACEVRLAPGVKSSGVPKIHLTVSVQSNEPLPVEDDSIPYDDDSDMDDMVTGKNEKKPNKVLEAKRDGLSIEPVPGEDDGDDMFGDLVDEDEGVQALAWMANRSWAAPSDYKSNRSEGTEPNEDLALEYVFGIRTWDARDFLGYNADGHLLYFAAAVGIVYDVAANKQKHFIKHQDDILSLAIHPQGRYVATGELGSNPKIYVWDSTADVIEAKAVLCGIKGMRGIVSLAFSEDGSQLACVCNDDDHHFFVYDWQNNTELAKGKCGNSRMFNLKFNPADQKFWATGANYVGYFDAKSKRPSKVEPLIKNVKTGCAAITFTKNSTLVGTGNGKILVLKGGSVSTTIDNAHEKSIQSIHASGQWVVSCGSDGKAHWWSSDMKDKSPKKTVEYDGEKVVTAGSNTTGDKWVVLTKSGRLFEGKPGEKGKLVFSYHHQGEQEKGTKHSQRYGDWGELWGCATHPQDSNTVVSCGDDGTIRWWDIQAQKMTNIIQLQDGERCRSVGFSADGSLVAVGCWDGRFYVFDGDGSNTKHHNNGKEKLKVGKGAKATEELEITDIKFSPDGEYLALGSKVSGSYIAVLNTSDWRMRGSLGQNNGVTSHVKMFDWNADSDALQILCGDWQLLYVQVPSVKLDPKSNSYADTQWASWNLVLGWPVQGIFPKRAERGANSYDNINSCDRSHEYSNSGGGFITCGDDSGFVRLFRYPCSIEDAASKKHLCHSSHVCRTRFNADDSYVCTAGGGDQCVMLWRVEK